VGRLRSFVAVARDLSFTRAAERLHITQPALSRSIRRLEQELGAPLFDRNSRHVELTPAGAALLEHATVAVAHADRGMAAARRAARGAAPALHVACTASLATGLMPRAAGRFAEANPHVELTLSEATRGAVCDGVVDGTFDVGLVYEGSDYGEDGLVVETLTRDPLCAVLPAQHPLAGRPSVALAALASEPWVALADPAARGLNLEVARHAGGELSVVQEATTSHVILGLVAAGVGVAVLPAAATSERVPGVSYLELEDPLELELLAVACGEPTGITRAFLDAAHAIEARG
jgi:DNA-binding transcriptional LysR family regulator